MEVVNLSDLQPKPLEETHAWQWLEGHQPETGWLRCIVGNQKNCRKQKQTKPVPSTVIVTTGITNRVHLETIKTFLLSTYHIEIRIYLGTIYQKDVSNNETTESFHLLENYYFPQHQHSFCFYNESLNLHVVVLIEKFIKFSTYLRWWIIIKLLC